jgi:hypothetical protein
MSNDRKFQIFTDSEAGEHHPDYDRKPDQTDDLAQRTLDKRCSCGVFVASYSTCVALTALQKRKLFHQAALLSHSPSRKATTDGDERNSTLTSRFAAHS